MEDYNSDMTGSKRATGRNNLSGALFLMTAVSLAMPVQAERVLEEVLVVVRSGGSVIYRERTAENGAIEFEPYDDEEGPFRIDALAPYYSPSDALDVKPGADVALVLEAQRWIEGTVAAPALGQGIVTLYTDA